MRKQLRTGKRHIKIGRPTRMTKELVEQIAADIGLGLTTEQACDLQYLRTEVFRTWCNKHAWLNDLIAHNRAKVVRARIVKADSGKPSDACWLLERLDSDRFARPEIRQQINLIAATMGETGSMHLTVQILQECRSQLNAIQALPGKPAELAPQLPSAELSPARDSVN